MPNLDQDIPTLTNEEGTFYRMYRFERKHVEEIAAASNRSGDYVRGVIISAVKKLRTPEVRSAGA